MDKFYRFLLNALESWVSLVVIILFCTISFFIGQLKSDMNLFAASGGVMTIFGLLSMIRFTTIEKYLQQQNIIDNSSGITGPPLRDEEIERIEKESRERARIKIKKELRSEIKGLALTVVGTIIWAYGVYVPLFKCAVQNT